MRSLIFTLWIQADKSASVTLSVLEKLVAKQFDTVERGGSIMVNASLSGKSFTYAIPPNWRNFEFEDYLYEAWKTLSGGGASGGPMTDAELSAYLLDADSELTDTLIAKVSINQRG